MRSFLAFLLLLVGLVAGTASLVAYVAHETVLDPANAGEVLADAMSDEEARDLLLSEAVPGYDQLPGAFRDEVDRVAESPQVDQALDQLSVASDGSVDLAPMRERLVEQLRANGLDEVAAAVESADQAVEVQLPDRIWGPYTDARANSWTVAVGGATVAVAAFVLALFAARSLRGAVAGIGVTLLLTAGAAFVLLASAATVAEMSGADTWVQAGAATLDPTSEEAAAPLLMVAIAGLALFLVSFALPRAKAYA